MNYLANLQDAAGILPELILLLGAVITICADMCLGQKNSKVRSITLGIISCLVALFSLHSVALQAPSSLYGGLIVLDQISIVYKTIFLIGTPFCLLFTLWSSEEPRERLGEYVALMLGATIGACSLVSANDILVFYVSLETLSLCSYVLVATRKRSGWSAESGMKYFLYGASSSCVFLFGASYMYGISATFSLNQSIATVLSVGGTSCALVLICIGVAIAFKLSLVPLQFWAPDAYQGSPAPVTAFLAVVSKAAGLGAAIRLFSAALTSLNFNEGGFLLGGLSPFVITMGIISVITMTLGNLIALRQVDAKRLFAYSAIAHAGYILLAFTVPGREALQAATCYISIYGLTTLGALWAVTQLIACSKSQSIISWKGLGRELPIVAAFLFVFLISLTGLPPTAGFSAKFLLFKVVIGKGLLTSQLEGGLGPQSLFYFGLAIIGVINSVVSLFYYMKFIHALILEEPQATSQAPVSFESYLTGFALCVIVVLLLNFEPLFNLVRV